MTLPKGRSAGIACFVAVLTALLCGCSPAEKIPAAPEAAVSAIEVLAALPDSSAVKELPEPVVYTLSFAGDCTLGTSHNTYGSAGSFVQIVGDNYSYPFENALDYFENDDFTIVNLEGTFTEYTVPEEKTFRFRAPSSYAKILTAGSVEAVNLANNHSFDFGQTGYDDTKAALESETVTYVEECGTALYTTQSGLKIGLYAAQLDIDLTLMAQSVAQLRLEGAEIVIVSYHWGDEGSYRPTDDQKNCAHAAIDAGADIVYGHHPHVLQPIELYNGGIIYYSLANFSFGGNRNPRDKDTAVIQQTVIREPDGTIRLGETTIIPFCVSSVSSKNDYKPTPYEEGSAKYERVLSKLDGSFTGPNLVVDYGNKTNSTEKPSATEETQAPTEETQPPAPAEDAVPTQAP